MLSLSWNINTELNHADSLSADKSIVFSILWHHEGKHLPVICGPSLTQIQPLQKQTFFNKCSLTHNQSKWAEAPWGVSAALKSSVFTDTLMVNKKRAWVVASKHNAWWNNCLWKLKSLKWNVKCCNRYNHQSKRGRREIPIKTYTKWHSGEKITSVHAERLMNDSSFSQDCQII